MSSSKALAHMILDNNVPLTIMSLILEMMHIETIEECFSVVIKKVLENRNNSYEIKNHTDECLMIISLNNQLRIIADTRVNAVMGVQLYDFGDALLKLHMRGKINAVSFVITEHVENIFTDINFVMCGTNESITFFEMYTRIKSGRYNTNHVTGW